MLRPTARPARQHLEAAPAARNGSLERGGSPWLGRSAPPSELFGTYRQLERNLTPQWTPAGFTLAPATPLSAFMDWWLHLATSPAKQWELMHFGAEQWMKAWRVCLGGGQAERCVEPLPQDKRFDDPRWRQVPYCCYEQAFLLRQQWWQRATVGVPGVTHHHEQMVSFGARQWLDMLAPSNFISLSPVVQQCSFDERGLNLVRGAVHAVEDLWREAGDLPPVGAEQYRVGRDIAVTPGRVVLRNRLMELIQYAPTTRSVHAEPVLIVPAWIMKYYVLDLSPHNSLIRHLVDRGFTVFAISWKNPDTNDRDLGMDDYDRLGVRAALEAIDAIMPQRPVHATGYCLGGTLLSISAAALARAGSPALKTLTLLAAQTDFSDPGELSLFIDEDQVAYLENVMARQGTLDKRQMRSTFQMLRSNDLIWSYRLYNYLLGERQPVSDLMAWNADGTRLPCRMHTEYLNALFLRNALARGELEIDGVPVTLHDLQLPIFSVGTVQDHVAPWRSVFKLHGLTNADQTFVLTSGGHNVGIVNPPGHAKSNYRLRHWRIGERRMTPDEWLEATKPIPGSWWTAWVQWLEQHSSDRTAPPPMGAAKIGLPPLEPAPGTYVHQR